MKADYLFAADLTFNIYNILIRLPIYAGCDAEQLYKFSDSFTIFTTDGVDLRDFCDQRELIYKGDTLWIVPLVQHSPHKMIDVDNFDHYMVSTVEATKLN